MDRPEHYTTYAEQLAALDDSQLVNAAAFVRELRHHGGWALVTDLSGRVADRELRACAPRGKPLSQAEYAEAHGVAEGISMALGLPEAVLYAADQREKANAESALAGRT